MLVCRPPKGFRLMAIGRFNVDTVRLRSQIVTLEIVAEGASGLRSQIVTSNYIY